MAIYQPSFVIPSSQSGPGNGVIDVTQGLTASWQVNGPTPMQAYQIVLMQNDINSTRKYATGIVTLSAPFYGTDAQGNKRTFTATTITGSTLQSYGLTNGYANGYKMNVGQYWDNGSNDVTSTFYTTGSITAVSVNGTTFASAVGSRGAYRYVYSSSFSGWRLNASGSTINLNTYGITVTGTPANGDAMEILYGYSATWLSSAAFFVTRTAPTLVIDDFLDFDYSFTAANITSVTIDQTMFVSKVGGVFGTYSFIYNYGWKLNGASVTISQYGISASGTATSGDEIVVFYGVNSGTIDFTATYTQAQGDALTMAHWQILDQQGNVILNQQAYGTNELATSYDGFISGQSYTITLTVVTENGVSVTATKDFSVDYPMSTIEGAVSACGTCGKSAVRVEWPGVSVINGSATGTYSVSDGSLFITNGTATWNTVNGDSMLLPADWTFVWRGRVTLSGTQSPVIIDTTTGLFHLYFTSGAFYVYFTPSGGSAFTLLNKTFLPTPSADDYYTLIISPSTVTVRWDHYTGGLLPSNTLYPSNSLYPSASSGISTSIYSAAYSYNQGQITGIRIGNGSTQQSETEYIWVINQGLTPEEQTELISGFGWEPSYDEKTAFLANFDSGLSAGNLDIAGQAITGFAIYRREGMSGSLLHLVDVNLNATKLFDYGAKSQTTYTYYMFPKGATSYVAEAIASNSVTPCFWDWTILETISTNPGVYEVINEYAFTNNLTSGNIINNNSPALQQNFTKYPTRQPVSSCYKSGTLQAYIGKVGMFNGTWDYQDTVSLADQIYALSESPNPKFLKDRKGNLWMVEIGAPIGMTTGDNMVQQPLMAAIPWVEIGSTDGIAIIQQ